MKRRNAYVTHRATPDEMVSEIAADINANGCILEWMDSAATWHSRMWLAGQIRGNAIAGCLCDFLDQEKLCLGDRDCPSAYHAHVLIADPTNHCGQKSYVKLCPVLVADVTKAFVMNDEIGGII